MRKPPSAVVGPRKECTPSPAIDRAMRMTLPGHIRAENTVHAEVGHCVQCSDPEGQHSHRPHNARLVH